MWETVVLIVVNVLALVLAGGAYRMGCSFRVEEGGKDVKLQVETIRKGALVLMGTLSMFAIVLLFVLYGMLFTQPPQDLSIWWLFAFGAMPFVVFWLPTYAFLAGVNRSVKRSGG